MSNGVRVQEYDRIPLSEAQFQTFWKRVYKTDKCWIWMGASKTLYSGNYGTFGANGQWNWAHRISYEQKHGKVPDGFVVDHLCRVTMCVNPDHLEAVTVAENFKRGFSTSAVNGRKTHCKRGHPFEGDNLRISTHNGKKTRICKKCKAEIALIYGREVSKAARVVGLALFIRNRIHGRSLAEGSFKNYKWFEDEPRPRAQEEFTKEERGK